MQNTQKVCLHCGDDINENDDKVIFRGDFAFCDSGCETGYDNEEFESDDEDEFEDYDSGAFNFED